MATSIKCSNCGEEISNVTVGLGRRQWLLTLFGFLPLLFILYTMQDLFLPSPSFEKELSVTLIETRNKGNSLVVVGRLNNAGDRKWTRIAVEAEFYDEDGNFLDETSSYMSMTLLPHGEEKFRLELNNASDRILVDEPEVVLKVSEADVDRF